MDEGKQGTKRQDVARAAFTVIARHGLDAASMRAIAFQMGCSTGVLTHYFRDKFELIKFVLDTALEQLTEQIAAIRTMDGSNSLAQMIMAMLPNSPENETLWRVMVAFNLASMNEPSLQQDQERREDLVIDGYERLLSDFKRDGVLKNSVDVKNEAIFMSCFVDGLASHVLMAPKRYNLELQKKLVDHYIGTITV
jgi:AcrR family transcriptional regulator